MVLLSVRIQNKHGDMPAGSLVRVAIFNRFPQRDQWAGKNLAELAATVAEESKRATKRGDEGEDEDERSRWACTKKEFQKAQDEAEMANARADRLSSEVQALREENQKLRTELAHANGRIAELERVLKRELAVA